jgi:arginine:ornithine antiporter/lysine permease
MPRFLSRVNRAGAPAAALIMTSVLIQIMLFVTLASEDAFNFMLNMTSALSLIPFVLAAGYALKISAARDGYAEQPDGRTRDLVVAAIATFYTVFLLYAAGTKYLLVSFIIYAPGTILFVMARREQGRKLFSPVELLILAVSVIGAVVGVIALVAGWITI